LDVLVLIDKLDELVQNAKSVPMTDQVRIDREEIWEIIDQMRSTIPEEIKQARWIVKERQEMLAEAKREQDRLLQEAREQAVREASQTEIVNRLRLAPAVTMSRLWSPFRSATATNGLWTPWSAYGVLNVPSPLPSRMSTPPMESEPVTRSRLPSPSTSPIATAEPVPTAYSRIGARSPPGDPNRTEMDSLFS